jgi:hypothetical protein
MKYLIKKTGVKVRAHIWTGEDTVCRMWSTGGLRQQRFEVREDRGDHQICHMCFSIQEQANVGAETDK